MPLPAKVLEYVELFDAGRYWDAHEALEDHWREDRVDFYKGMIQVAAAFVHVDKRNWLGARKVLLRALPYLEACPTTHRGFDVAAVCDHGRRLLDAVERLEAGELEEFDESLRFRMRNHLA